MTTTDEKWVPCEMCEIEVPRFLATVEPESGGHLCDACVLVLQQMVQDSQEADA